MRACYFCGSPTDKQGWCDRCDEDDTVTDQIIEDHFIDMLNEGAWDDAE